MNEIEINSNSPWGPYGNFKKKKKADKPLLRGHENQSCFSQYEVSRHLRIRRLLPVSSQRGRKRLTTLSKGRKWVLGTKGIWSRWKGRPGNRKHVWSSLPAIQGSLHLCALTGWEIYRPHSNILSFTNREGLKRPHNHCYNLPASYSSLGCKSSTCYP